MRRSFICVLGWDRVGRRFAESCLVIPSREIGDLARVEGEWLVLELEPGSAVHRRLQPYSVSVAARARGQKFDAVKEVALSNFCS